MVAPVDVGIQVSGGVADFSLPRKVPRAESGSGTRKNKLEYGTVLTIRRFAQSLSRAMAGNILRFRLRRRNQTIGSALLVQ